MFSYYQLDSTVSTKIWGARKHRLFGKAPLVLPRDVSISEDKDLQQEKQKKQGLIFFCLILVAEQLYDHNLAETPWTGFVQQCWEVGSKKKSSFKYKMNRLKYRIGVGWAGKEDSSSWLKLPCFLNS